MIGIFGGTGFIGQNLVRYFYEKKTPIKVFSRNQISCFQGDSVLMDFHDPSTYIEEIQDITVAVMLINGSVPGTYADDIASEVKQNVLPYSCFFKSLRNCDLKKVIYMSSGGTVYGTLEQGTIDESHITAPINPYGCAKLMIETMLKTVSLSAGWDYTILRPSNPIGRGQKSSKGQGLVAAAIAAVRNDTKLDIWGDGETVRDYFDVRDLCTAIELSIFEKNAQNQTYNVGSSRGSSINQILDQVETISKGSIKRVYCGERAVDVTRSVLNTTKINEDLNWKCKYSLVDTIKHMLD